jgi:hypothetical protein
MTFLEILERLPNYSRISTMFFLFAALEFELRAYTLRHSTSLLFFL